MNERIRELAEQSGFNFYDLHDIDGQDLGETVEADSWSAVDKFAELIVKECCSKLVEMGEGWLEFANNPPRGQEHNASGALFAAYRLKEDAVNEIQEHFGVG